MIRNSRLAQRFTALLIVLTIVAPLSAQRVRVYHAAQIWTGKGKPITEGTLIVKGSKVVTVGKREALQGKLPAGAIEVDLGHRVLIPGLVIAETSLAEPGRDEERSLTPSVQAVEGFDFFADQWKQLSGGVTTVQLAPGARRLMPGRGSVVKLAGNSRVLRLSESLRVVLSTASRRPPRIYRPPIGAVSVDRPLQQTQPQIGGTLGDAVAGLRLVFRTASQYRPDLNDSVETQFMLLAINAMQKRRGVVRITAQRAVEVQAALNLSREFQFPLLLVTPSNLDMVVKNPSAWKSQLHGVILQPPHRPGMVINTAVPAKGARKVTSAWEYAAKLHKLGVPVAIKPQSDSGLSEMLFLAGSFVSSKLSRQAVMEMVTSIPAKMLGVSSRVGELATGKDADFVVLSADPFSTRANVEATYVSGTKVYDTKTKNATTVVKADRVYTDKGVIANGSVVVKGETIRSVGQDVSAPLDADVRRFPKGAVVVPGFIDFGSAISSSTSPSAKVARQGGVTTVLRASGSNVSAFKLGDKTKVIQSRVAMKFAVSGNLTSTIPSLRATLKRGLDYHNQWLAYEAELKVYNEKLKAYELKKAKEAAAAAAAKKKSTTKAAAKPAAKGTPKSDPKKTATTTKSTTTKAGGASAKPGSKKTTTTGKPKTTATAKKTPAKKPEDPNKPKAPKKPKANRALDAYRALFSGKIPAMVEARKSHTVNAALKLFRDEFKLRTVLVGGDALARIPDEVAKKKVAVAVGPNLVPTVDRKQANLAQMLANRQVPFAFQSNASTGARSLPLAVTYAVRKGLGTEDALTGLTSGAAELVSIQQRVGSLTKGKDADLVVLSGPPFELSTRVLAVMIDGRWVYERDKQK